MRPGLWGGGLEQGPHSSQDGVTERRNAPFCSKMHIYFFVPLSFIILLCYNQKEERKEAPGMNGSPCGLKKELVCDKMIPDGNRGIQPADGFVWYDLPAEGGDDGNFR